MEKYFSPYYSGEPFRLFSRTHLYTLLLIGLVMLLLSIVFMKFRDGIRKSCLRYVLAGLLIFLETTFFAWNVAYDVWSPSDSLPLHLCDAAIILGAVMLSVRSFLLFELIYFWGIGGSLQALLTPDIVRYNFPHFLYFQFFTAHTAIVIAVLYMVLVEGYRPYHSSIWKVFLMTNLYMLVVAPINLLVDGNYLFICEKPAGATLMDYLGPWPWYILSLEPIAVAVFYICYLPFLLKDLLGRFTGMVSRGRGTGLGA